MSNVMLWLLASATIVAGSWLMLIVRRDLKKMQRDMQRLNWPLMEAIYKLRDQLAGDELRR